MVRLKGLIRDQNVPHRNRILCSKVMERSPTTEPVPTVYVVSYFDCQKNAINTESDVSLDTLVGLT